MKSSVKIKLSKLYFEILYEIPENIWENHCQGIILLPSLLERIYNMQIGFKDSLVVTNRRGCHQLFVTTEMTIYEAKNIIKNINLELELFKQLEKIYKKG